MKRIFLVCTMLVFACALSMPIFAADAAADDFLSGFATSETAGDLGSGMGDAMNEHGNSVSDGMDSVIDGFTGAISGALNVSGFFGYVLGDSLIGIIPFAGFLFIFAAVLVVVVAIVNALRGH